MAQIFREYCFVGPPVTDYDDHLLGILPVREILGLVVDAASQHYSGLGRVNVEEINEHPVKAASRRFAWLISLLFLGMAT
ncbi:magnesium transporter, partial [Enterococcus lactis]|nr:magnesium transporter [Enterococcus lactis]